MSFVRLYIDGGCIRSHRRSISRAGYECIGRGGDHFGAYLVAEDEKDGIMPSDWSKDGISMVVYEKSEPPVAKRYGWANRLLASFF